MVKIIETTKEQTKASETTNTTAESVITQYDFFSFSTASEHNRIIYMCQTQIEEKIYSICLHG